MPYVYKKNGKLNKTKKLQKILRENGVKAVKSIICSNNYYHSSTETSSNLNNANKI